MCEKAKVNNSKFIQIQDHGNSYQKNMLLLFENVIVFYTESLKQKVKNQKTRKIVLLKNQIKNS